MNMHKHAITEVPLGYGQLRMHVTFPINFDGDMGPVILYLATDELESLYEAASIEVTVFVLISCITICNSMDNFLQWRARPAGKIIWTCILSSSEMFPMKEPVWSDLTRNL